MAKLADRIERIGQTVTAGYKKIENDAVNGYKKVETGAVRGFGAVSDKCIDVFFAKDGETVEDAKQRLKKNT